MLSFRLPPVSGLLCHSQRIVGAAVTPWTLHVVDPARSAVDGVPKGTHIPTGFSVFGALPLRSPRAQRIGFLVQVLRQWTNRIGECQPRADTDCTSGRQTWQSC